MWGIEDTVKERFGNRVTELKLNRRIVNMYMPMTPSDVCEHFIKYFGPTNTLYEMLNDEKRAQFKKDFIKLFASNNLSKDSITTVDAEYLEVIAAKR